MKKLVLLAALCAMALPVVALAADPVKHFQQSAILGFYRGQTVEYLDFGPVRLARGNKTAPIWAFTNGAAGQVNIIDAVPGQRAYSPLWAVRLVTWKDGIAARVLKSAAAVKAAAARGDVSVEAARVVVNCPVI